MLDVLQDRLKAGRKASEALAVQLLGERRAQTLALRRFALWKVPMLLACSPSVIELCDAACVIAIPLRYRTRNHFRSMYFGALACGTDCAVGLLAQHHIDRAGGRVSLLFKDFHASFLRRPEADVHFVCRQGPEVAAAVQQAQQSGERVNVAIAASAMVPSRQNEHVADFSLTLSLKATRK